MLTFKRMVKKSLKIPKGYPESLIKGQAIQWQKQIS